MIPGVGTSQISGNSMGKVRVYLRVITKGKDPRQSLYEKHRWYF